MQYKLHKIKMFYMFFSFSFFFFPQTIRSGELFRSQLVSSRLSLVVSSLMVFSYSLAYDSGNCLFFVIDDVEAGSLKTGITVIR